MTSSYSAYENCTDETLKQTIQAFHLFHFFIYIYIFFFFIVFYYSFYLQNFTLLYSTQIEALNDTSLQKPIIKRALFFSILVPMNNKRRGRKGNSNVVHLYSFFFLLLPSLQPNNHCTYEFVQIWLLFRLNQTKKKNKPIFLRINVCCSQKKKKKKNA